MDKGYQKLLKYYVIACKSNFSDALGIVEKYANANSPRRRSFEDRFENGYYFIQFLIKYYRHLKSGFYIFEIGNYYPGCSYYYVIHIGDPLGKIPALSSKSANYPLPDPHLSNQANQKLYSYEIVGSRDYLDDALIDIEGLANRDFPKRSFEKDDSYPERYFFKNGENKEDQYKYGFKNGYEFIWFLNKYRNVFKRGYYIFEIGRYYDGGYKYYIIKFY